MKKLLLVLMVVAMASFLFVGCIPSPTPEPEPEPDPDPTPVAITATIVVADEWLDTATGKTYVQAGNQEITVTFSEAVENPVVKVGTVVVPVFTLDQKVFKGTGSFVGPCDAVMITVGGVCDDLCAAKSVVVDSEAPVISLKAEVEECDCDEGYQLVITSTGPTPACGDATDCCGDDDCSGLESVLVEIYAVYNDVTYPWELCCDLDECAELIGSDDSCAIEAKTECIPDVYTQSDGWVDFFDETYYVKAVLEDKVGNVNTYYGEVTATDKDTVTFRELVVDPVTCDWCYAWAEAVADDVIGECLPPATECYVEPPVALICPTVTPETATVGVETTITLTFNRDVDESVDGQIMAYISDGAKSTPPNIPDNALPLFLVQDASDLKVFTGEVTFDTPGSKVLYVLWDCDSCSPCIYEINVTPIKACPEIAWFNADGTLLIEGENGTVIDGVTWLKGGNTYRFRLTYDHVITSDEKKLYEVRIRDYAVPSTPGATHFDDFRTLADMDATDDMVFRGDFTPPAGDYCTEAYVEVDILEDCCEPCMYKFGVDAELPYAEVKISTEDCCGFAFLEFDSTPVDCDETCCGDDCTEVVAWTIDIFNAMPTWDCCELQTASLCHHEGTSCPIDVNWEDCATCCLSPGTYWIVTSLTDAVGNVKEYYDEVTISGSLGSWLLTDTEYEWVCDIICDGEGSNPFIHGIPGVLEGPAATVVYGDTCGECLDECPVVTLSDWTPMVGQVITITIDYSDAIKPDNPVAYVGPAIKILPLGIPEGAQELVLTDNGDYTYTATYTFGQAGTDYIYVVDGCADCTPCKTGVTVSARICPDIAIDDAVAYLDDMYIDSGDHDITVTFASPLPIEQVRIFVVESLGPDWDNPIIQEDAVELIISTTNNLVYTAEGEFEDSGCDDFYIIVQYGESCCPVICMEKFIVDGADPVISLAATVVDCSDCDSAEEVWISSDTCAYDIADCPCTSTTVCGDVCTTFDWTLTVYDDQPLVDDGNLCGDCIANTCANVVATDSGTGCEVDLNVFGCVLCGDDAAALVGTYYVVLEAIDIVGNTLELYDSFTISTADCITVTYNSGADLGTDCLID